MTKILLIEDEMVMREEILEWLKLEGYEAFGAEDGMKGVEAAFHYLPDLIISDIMMPHLDGYGVLLEVHANPATMSIPFVFLTAKAAHEDVRKGMDLGADDYVTKPFTRLELLHAIQTRLTRKASQDRAYQHNLDQLHTAMAQEHEHRILKAKLVSMFSHDFANSLTSILMTNSLLRSYADRMDENRRLAHLNRIESSTRRLLQMLDDLLVVAQMETGNLIIEPELLNVGHFLQRFQEDCQAIYTDSYQIVLENHVNSLLWIDVRLLRLILANLVANATKKSPRGSTIRVTLDYTETECRSIFLLPQTAGQPSSSRSRCNQESRNYPLLYQRAPERYTFYTGNGFLSVLLVRIHLTPSLDTSPPSSTMRAVPLTLLISGTARIVSLFLLTNRTTYPVGYILQPSYLCRHGSP